ncbi:PAP/25A associated domain containing protein [Aphelenchoides avenae]|nr:PAP/25A associated domain containing protein [Aphelenchus avenae]
MVAENPLPNPYFRKPVDALVAKLTHDEWQEPVDEQRERLTRECWEFFERNRQDETTFEQKMRVRDALYNALAETFPECDVVEIGSTLTRCGLNDSDLDVCLIVPENDSEYCNRKKTAKNILPAVRKVLKQPNNVMFRRMDVLKGAKVPILKMKAKLEDRYIEVDLNVNNIGGVYNSFLLYHYANYALNLMVLHYLLYACSPPVLPNLLLRHSDHFSRDIPLENLKLLSEPFPWMDPAATRGTPKNNQSLGELLLGFFDYYAEFDFLNQVIAVSGPYPLSRTTLQLVWTKMWAEMHAGPILVVDPYEFYNPARSVSYETFPRIAATFKAARDAVRDLGRSASIHALFESAAVCNAMKWPCVKSPGGPRRTRRVVEVEPMSWDLDGVVREAETSPDDEDDELTPWPRGVAAAPVVVDDEASSGGRSVVDEEDWAPSAAWCQADQDDWTPSAAW